MLRPFFKKNILSETRDNWTIPLFDYKDLIRDILYKYLTLEEAKKFANASNQFNQLVADKIITSEATQKLLQHIVFGEEHEANAILKKNPRLLLEEDCITDYSNRTFFNHTAFELAKWAYDLSMCHMLLKHFQQLSNGLEIAKKQFERVITYQIINLDEKTILSKQENHYDFHEIISFITTYIEAYPQWISQSQEDKRDQYWRNKVGGAQRKVPVWIAQHYCQNFSLHVSKETSRSLTLWDQSNFFDQHPDFQLGVHYAISSRLRLDKGPSVTTQEPLSSVRGLQHELADLITLQKQTAKDFVTLKEELFSQEHLPRKHCFIM